MFVLSNLIGCIGFGLLLALLLSGGLAFLAHLLFSPYRSQGGVILVVVAMFLLLLFQSVLLVGAWYAKDYVADLTAVGTQTVAALANDANLNRLIELLDVQEVQEMAQAGIDMGVSAVAQLTDSLGNVIGNQAVTNLANDANLDKLTEQFDVQRVQEMAQAGIDTGVSTVTHLADSLNSVINGYIWRRIGWMALVAVLGMTALGFMGGGSSSRSRNSRRGSARPVRAHASHNRAHRSVHRRR